MKRVGELALIIMGSGLWCGVVQAANTNWIGSADYAQAPGGQTTATDVVGPFNTYDFAAGAPVLIQGIGGSNPQSAQVGDTYNGYYQGYVSQHLLGNTAVSSPNIDTQGANGPQTGYELTVAASFQATVTGVAAGNVNYNITSGTFNLYFDPHPNYNFTGDSGFSDGTSILTGTIIGGSGGINGGDNGSASLQMLLTSFNTNVFNPATLTAGKSLFSLDLTDTQATAGITQVQGHPISTTDVIASADGKMVLSVPEPESWMMMPAGLGVVALASTRRKSKTSKS